MADILDWLGAVALLAITGLVKWTHGIGKTVAAHEARLAVVETMPAILRDIRDEVRGLRADSVQSNKDLYQHIDNFRQEVKEDLRNKADK